MLATVAVVSALLFGILYLGIIPFIGHLRDPKKLRKYPQLSMWSGISDLPFIIEAHKGFRSRRLAELHKVHPVVRIGPNSLSYGTHQAVKDIYGHSTRCTKDVMYEVLSGSHYHLADVIDKVDHQRKRKVLSSAFALKNLEGWEHKVADMTSRMVKAFESRCTEPPVSLGDIPREEDLTIDLWRWANFFAVSAIANIALSEDLGFLEQGDDLITSERMDGSTKKVHFKECLSATAWAQSNLVWSYKWYPTFVRLSKLLSRTYRQKWKQNEDWDGIVLNRATTRLKRYRNGEKLDDFFSVLMEDKNGRSNDLEWGEIIAEISIMMNAGSDTTAIAITNVIYRLLKNPDCMAKLRQEIDEALDEDDFVAPYDKVRHLPYLRACLDESLRIMPPNTFGLPRRTPPEGALILGDWVSGDTSVSMSAYVAHRDEAVFPEPERFIPERWLGEAGRELQPFFVAFSAGARGCIGRNISYLEQYILLATLLRHFEFALPSHDWEPRRRELFTCQLRFFDETESVAAQCAEPDFQSDQNAREPGSTNSEDDPSDPIVADAEPWNSDAPIYCASFNSFQVSSPAATRALPGPSGFDAGVTPQHGQSENGSGHSSFSPPYSTVSSHGTQDLSKQSYLGHSSKLLRAVLVRHFVDHLAYWFDLCDPEKHFEFIVPQLARTSPPLMNAILCVSATHLSRLSEEKRARHSPQLPAFGQDTAIYFHTEAIQPLMRLTANSVDLRDGNILAATVLLRWHEEIDAAPGADNQDSELFMRVKNLLIIEQFKFTPNEPHSSPSSGQLVVSPEPNASGEIDDASSPLSLSLQIRQNPGSSGLRRASFWIAFRQEIYTCFLNQRSFAIPLLPCSGFRSFNPAADVVWANRLIVFCADCIEFCYGSAELQEGSKAIPSLTSSAVDLVKTRWTTLKDLEQQWEQKLPSSFEPIYSSVTDDTSPQDVFPELWYLSAAHVTGLQHLELARILLTVHNPHLPRLGLGYFAKMQEQSFSIRSITRRLCGMALGNRRLPPALATACLGITTCGEYFQERREQEALLGIVDALRVEHGWPFRNTASRLRAAWGWDP
ncbi:uncharacterized protein PV07_02316 [Cladophialophora immunda]|uniref:Transcription factor domain-containing protein n=1 Tax=Cladophialophora immunda TaxID=569365 RepID=A0A0D2A5I8_9EURO|nr:uncharacterized protein PV07_02316 [Cladophialophora immunda]KIW35631.1 hypothetical protein PV07_02316 [Cladophialophora immunda]